MFNILSVLSRLLHAMLGISTPNNFPPPLTSEEEDEAFVLAKKGDSAAREKLIVHNLRLVSHIVRKYYSSAKNQEDLVSLGTIGLIKAVDSYDTGHKTRFATYAAKCIQNEILMHFRSQRKLQNEVSINDAIDTDRDGNPLTSAGILVALARELGVSTDYLLTGSPQQQEENALQDMLLRRITSADRRLEQRKDRPFSRQELAVLFAAMLMEE